MSLVDTAARTPDATPDPADVAAGAPASAGDAVVRGRVQVVLPMRHAGTRALEIGYELRGAAGAPLVFVAGGISAHRHLASNAAHAEAGWADRKSVV